MLLLVMFVTLVRTWLRIELTLSIEISLSCNFGKMRYLTSMITCKTASLMLNRNLLLLLRVLTMSSICHSPMNITTGNLLVNIWCLGLFYIIISILLISILRLHHIIIIDIVISIKCLFLSSIMCVIDLVSNLRIGVIHLIWRLNHVHILMIWNMMRLQMIFFF